MGGGSPFALEYALVHVIFERGGTYDSAIFGDEECNWHAGAVDDCLGVADDQRCGVDWALAVLGAEQEERRVEFAGGLEIVQKGLEARIDEFKRGLERRIWGACCVQVASLLLGRRYGLEIGCVERRCACRILGTVHKASVGPVAKCRPLLDVRFQPQPRQVVSIDLQ